jgi:hypothetical protein
MIMMMTRNLDRGRRPAAVTEAGAVAAVFSTGLFPPAPMMEQISTA